VLDTGAVVYIGRRLGVIPLLLFDGCCTFGNDLPLPIGVENALLDEEEDWRVISRVRLFPESCGLFFGVLGLSSVGLSSSLSLNSSMTSLPSLFVPMLMYPGTPPEWCCR